ncbi:M42 family metallopeptidase [Paradesulfitobacterium aromaticivorans]
MLLKKLSELNGASGAEKAVREALKEMISPYVDSVFVDKIGNLIAEKKGRLQGPRVLLAAHMDEIALMVTDITGDGFLKFKPVGGIDARILVSKAVKINENITGVIGAKAIHLQKAGERHKALTYEQLYIDIGAKSRDEASQRVNLGDYAYFITSFAAFGDGLWKGKALDDRVGCAALVEILQNEYDFPIIAAFTVQEEIGLRGARVAAYHTEPDFAIVVETTVAADTLDRQENEWVTEVGKGPACSVMDRSTLYNPKLVRLVTELAAHKGIPLQLRRGGSGGNDAGRIHLSKSGVTTIALSVPCRYIHAPVSVISDKDYQGLISLIDQILREIPANPFFRKQH